MLATHPKQQQKRLRSLFIKPLHAFDNTQHGADLFDLKVQGNIYTRIMNPTTAVRATPCCSRRRNWCFSLGWNGSDYLCCQTITEAGTTLPPSQLYMAELIIYLPTPYQNKALKFAFDYQQPESLRNLIDDKTKLVLLNQWESTRKYYRFEAISKLHMNMAYLSSSIIRLPPCLIKTISIWCRYRHPFAY